MDAISIAQRGIEWLQNERSNSLASAIAVSSVIPGEAFAFGTDGTMMVDF